MLLCLPDWRGAEMLCPFRKNASSCVCGAFLLSKQSILSALISSDSACENNKEYMTKKLKFWEHFQKGCDLWASNWLSLEMWRALFCLPFQFQHSLSVSSFFKENNKVWMIVHLVVWNAYWAFILRGTRRGHNPSSCSFVTPVSWAVISVCGLAIYRSSKKHWGYAVA